MSKSLAEDAVLILHHYDFSNFAEKIRLIFGLKDLAWRSCIAPMVLPKPDLTLLTGGYRKIPVMQIGADIYCDTAGIALELERRFPKPSLFPDGSFGLAMALANWSEKTLLWPTARFATGTIADDLPPEFHADRADMWDVPLDVDRYKAAAPRHKLQMLAQLAFVESMLARSNGLYILGPKISLADIAIYHPLWLVGQCSPDLTSVFAPFPKLDDWMRRLRSAGHGCRTEISAGEAIKVAQSAVPLTPSGIFIPPESTSLRLGDAVAVRPMDYGKDKVAGDLHSLSFDQISVARTNPLIGETIVNFPFAGYRVSR